MHDKSDDTHTANGVEITPGLWVWNNDLQSVQVDEAQFNRENGNYDALMRQADPTATVYSQVWYRTKPNGLFNGTRMTTVFEGFAAHDYPGMTFAEAKAAYANAGSNEPPS